MAKDEDTRTPEELAAYANECRRVAAETRKRAEADLKVADEWDALADDSEATATQRRGAAKADSKTPAKRGK